ncbi:hypothetical protein [Nonlabens sp. Asnod3-A02]|uniref:hypothetical protein n=1 Tax=Nonlabens sp. Asnod3-A02 TaxID=3160579 RepID=UPI003868BFD6
MGRAIDELFAQIFSGLNFGDPQHLLMANAFVEAIGNSLEQWHNDPSVSSIEYTRMAWSGGMKASTAFQDLDFNFQNDSNTRNAVESQIFFTKSTISIIGNNTK